MFTQPYSIYIDKRPMRIVFLVDPFSTNIEIIDQIIDYNQALWGGRFNPIMLTDGHTIEDKWWKFLREIDPDVIRTLVPLDIKLIERFENFLSPLTIEQSGVRTQSSVYEKPVGIDINTLNFFELGVLYGEPTLGIFNLDEMDDEIAKLFVLRNFGTYEPTNTRFHIGGTFRVPQSLASALEQGEIPTEVHEGFKKASVPFSKEVFSKKPVQRPESWAIIDRENKQIQYVEPSGSSLYVQPKTESFRNELSEIKRKICLITDRQSLANALLEFAHTPNIIFRNQVCALPNTERECKTGTWVSDFQIIVGDTLQDIVYFWNRPLLLPRSERGRINQMWLPKTLATDPDMEKALCAWIARRANLGSQTRKTVRFVSFSTEKRELEDIASRFRESLHAQHKYVHTVADCFEEPQIPNFRSEDPLSFQRDNPFSFRENTIDIHRVHGNEGILELTEPKGIAQHGSAGHWMIDFYIEFTHDMYEDDEYVIKMPGETLFWRFPNQNHLMHEMFDKPSRVKRNGFPSIMMQSGKKVLSFTLKEAEPVVASLFRRVWIPTYKHGDPRTQAADKRYYSVAISDKGKYLQGVLELFGSLTFAYKVFSSSYWRGMFDTLSKNTHAEQHAHESIANKLTKLIGRSGSLTVENQRAIESLTAHIVNESKKLDLKQKEFPFDAFVQEANHWREKYTEYMVPVDDQSEEDMIGFRSEDVKDALQQLARRNIIQIGVKPRCPSCGIVSWYHVDDIRQHLTCQGCRIQFPLDPELTWYYRLNGLIHAAHALHGTTPVILVLGQLLRESRTSFLFSPNLNLLTEPQDESSEKLKTTAEVDIACIQDGRFIIGEVKQSMSRFKEKDFDDIAEIVERTKPDIVLFSCIDSWKPKPSIVGHIERIRDRLSPLEIEVKWYKLRYLTYTVSV